MSSIHLMIVNVVIITSALLLGGLNSASANGTPSFANCAAATGAVDAKQVTGELAQLIAELQMAWTNGDFSQARVLHSMAREVIGQAQSAGLSLSGLTEDIARQLNTAVAQLEIKQNEAREASIEQSPFRGWAKIQEWHATHYSEPSFSSNNKHVLFSKMGLLGIFEMTTGLEVAHVSRDVARSATFSPDGLEILATYHDKVVLGQIIGDQFAPRVTLPKVHTVPVIGGTFNREGTMAATIDEQGNIVVWDVKLGTQIEHFKNSLTADEVKRLYTAFVFDEPNSLRFSPDSKTILAGHRDGKARLWKIGTPAPIHVFTGHTDLIWCARFSPDGKQVATASLDKQVNLWATDSGSLLQTLPHQNAVWEVAFSPDGRELATTSGEEVTIWHLKTGAPIHKLRSPFGIATNNAYRVQYSPDGEKIVSVFGLQVSIWERIKPQP